MKVTILDVQGEAFIELPPETLARMNWKPGDELSAHRLPDGVKLVRAEPGAEQDKN